MALIICSDCGKIFFRKANICPRCGKINQKARKDYQLETTETKKSQPEPDNSIDIEICYTGLDCSPLAWNRVARCKKCGELITGYYITKCKNCDSKK